MFNWSRMGEELKGLDYETGLFSFINQCKRGLGSTRNKIAYLAYIYSQIEIAHVYDLRSQEAFENYNKQLAVLHGGFGFIFYQFSQYSNISFEALVGQFKKEAGKFSRCLRWGSLPEDFCSFFSNGVEPYLEKNNKFYKRKQDERYHRLDEIISMIESYNLKNAIGCNSEHQKVSKKSI